MTTASRRLTGRRSVATIATNSGVEQNRDRTDEAAFCTFDASNAYLAAVLAVIGAQAPVALA